MCLCSSAATVAKQGSASTCENVSGLAFSAPIGDYNRIQSSYTKGVEDVKTTTLHYSKKSPHELLYVSYKLREHNNVYCKYCISASAIGIAFQFVPQT